MPFVRTLLGILVAAFAPIILVFAGAGLMSLGATYSSGFIALTGAIVIGVGIIWGIVLYLYHGGT